MYQKNLINLILDNCIIKVIPQLNVVKFQRKYISDVNNIYNIDKVFNRLDELIYNKNNFLYVPSAIYKLEDNNNHWLLHEKNYIWRPHISNNYSIELKLINDYIYLKEDLNEHPDITNLVEIDNQFDIDNKLLSVSLDDFKNKNISYK